MEARGEGLPHRAGAPIHPRPEVEGAQGIAGEQGFIAGKYRAAAEVVGERPGIIWSLATIGFIRTVKRPLVAILLIISFLITLFMPFLMILESSFDPDEFDGDSFPSRPRFDIRMNLDFYIVLTPFAILFTALSAGRFISSDMSDRSIYLYLVRPITRADYMAGRLLSSVLLLTVVVILPNILLWVLQMGMSGGGTSFLLGKLWTLGALIIHGLFYSVVFALVGLAFSASTSRSHWSLVGIFVIFLVSLPMAEAFAEESGNDNYLIFSITRDLDVLGSHLLRVDAEADLGWGAALGMLALISAACVGFILHRLQNVEAQL